MLQQINFYPLLPKPAKYQLTPLLSIRLLLSFVGLLMLIYFFNCIIYFWQKQKLADLQQTQDLAQQQLTQLTKRYEDNDQNKPLSWQNQQLIAELNDKQNRLVQLKQTAPAVEQGYASYLLSFAKTVTPGMWLTQIHITANNQQVDLIGSATNSAAIMQFIKNLGQESVFNNKAFNVLHLQNSTENNSILNFTLSTKSQGQTSNADGKTS